MMTTRDLIYFYSLIKYKSFTSAIKNPERAYIEVWREIRNAIGASSFWKGKIKATLEEHEITTLDDYTQALDACLDSPVSTLNGEKILFWSQTTGTTGKQKLFPLTPSFKRQFQRTIPPMVHSFLGRYKNFLKEPVLYFTETDPRVVSKANVDIGFISNYNNRNVSGLLKRKYAFPKEVFRDGATFVKYSPIYALAQDVSAIFSVTPISQEHLIARIMHNQEFILSYLGGKVELEKGLPPPNISKERLEYLTSLFKVGDFRFKKLWPSLEFICTWKTSICAAKLQQISKYIEGIDIIDAVYSATEGWMNVPIVEAKGSVLHPGAHIFEFIESGKAITKENLLKPWNLTPGKSYEIFLTTAMGMIRYRLYDIVKCTGYFYKAPLIEFSHKAANIISLGPAAVSEAEIVEAIMACGELASEKNIRVGPCKHGNGLVIYLDKEIDGIQAKIKNIHNYLKTLNINYEIENNKKYIEDLTYEILPPEHAFWKPKGEFSAQVKPSLLSQEWP